jgi:hypothetical protein
MQQEALVWGRVPQTVSQLRQRVHTWHGWCELNRINLLFENVLLVYLHALYLPVGNDGLIYIPLPELSTRR